MQSVLLLTLSGLILLHHPPQSSGLVRFLVSLGPRGGRQHENTATSITTILLLNRMKTTQQLRYSIQLPPPSVKPQVQVWQARLSKVDAIAGYNGKGRDRGQRASDRRHPHPRHPLPKKTGNTTWCRPGRGTHSVFTQLTCVGINTPRWVPSLGRLDFGRSC